MLAALALTAAEELAGASFEEHVALLYRPFQAERVTMSPDGRRVAFTQQVRSDLEVVIMDVDQPSRRVTVVVDEDREVAFSKEKERAQLRFLRWATPDLLVMAPTEEMFRFPVPAGRPAISGLKYIGPIMVVDASGKNGRTLVNGADFSLSMDIAPPGAEESIFVEVPRRTSVLGFPAGDREHVLVEAIGGPPLARHLGPVPTAIFKLNLATGKLSSVGEENQLGKYLYDWEGRARIVNLQPDHTAVRDFMHRAGSRGGWVKMDATWNAATPTGFSVSPENYFGPRAVPLGVAFDGAVLYYGANHGRDTFSVYGLDLATGAQTLALEHPHRDLVPLEPEFPSRALVFDEPRRRLVGVRSQGLAPLTIWSDQELSEVQRELDRKFTQRTVEILEWDDARGRFLLRVTGGHEPGRYFVFKRDDDVLWEFLRRAPWLRPAELHSTQPFEFDTPAGVHLTGYLTLPRAPRLRPPPLVMFFPGGFPGRASADFDREAQILAGMGFVVARVNHRGTTGFGARHRDAIQAGVDRVPVEDALATIDYVAARHPIDRRRIATMGEGFGGYLALRALQLHPAVFRCAVAINAPLDLGVWLTPPVRDIEAAPKVDFTQEVNRAFFSRSPGGFKAASVLQDAAMLTKPVFLIVDPVAEREIAVANQRLRGQLQRLDRAPEFFEVREDFALRLPAARARAFRQIEAFFNLNLYDYKVNVGETKEVK